MHHFLDYIYIQVIWLHWCTSGMEVQLNEHNWVIKWWNYFFLTFLAQLAVVDFIKELDAPIGLVTCDRFIAEWDRLFPPLLRRFITFCAFFLDPLLFLSQINLSCLTNIPCFGRHLKYWIPLTDPSFFPMESRNIFDWHLDTVRIKTLLFDTTEILVFWWHFNESIDTFTFIKPKTRQSTESMRLSQHSRISCMLLNIVQTMLLLLFINDISNLSH